MMNVSLQNKSLKLKNLTYNIKIDLMDQPP